jgi:hypothetical protein
VKAGGAAPQGRKKTSPGAEKHPVPANWITMANKVKGDEFQVPEGTTYKTEPVKGLDIHIAQTPRPITPSSTKSGAVSRCTAGARAAKVKPRP